MTEPWATSVDLHVDPGAAGGRRTGLEHALRDAVRSGRLAAGSRVPSSRALAADLGLSRGTVSAAYDQLIAEGYLSARQGSGTVVAALGERPAHPAPPAPDDAPPRHDLRTGQPDVTLFPAAAWAQALRRALAAAPAEVLRYSEPAGLAGLREELAGYLGRARGVLATPDQIVITSGYVQALALLTGVLARSGAGALAMEDPGLDMHREVVTNAGLAVAPLPVDADGARPGALAGAQVSAVVVTPAHQYPTGATLPPERRHALAEWARRTGGLVIEDDYDGEFRYDRQPVGAMQGMAPGHVVYAGSASKTLAPGVRLGWMVLPPRLAGPVAEAKRLADHHTSVLDQLALAELIRGHGYDRHIRAARLRYRRRRDLLVDRLSPLLAGGRTGVRGVAAGLHALISLPDGGPGEAEVLDLAAAEGLAVGGLREHWHRPGRHPQGIIAGYGRPSESAYRPALEALARVLAATRR